MRKFNIGQNVKIQAWGESHNGIIIDSKYVGVFKKYGVEFDFDASNEEDGSLIKKKAYWFSPYDIFNCPKKEE